MNLISYILLKNMYTILKLNSMKIKLPLISIGKIGFTKFDDITIMKKDCQNQEPGNSCVQQIYDYNGIENALCGNDKFDISSFFVIQMK